MNQKWNGITKKKKIHFIDFGLIFTIKSGTLDSFSSIQVYCKRSHLKFFIKLKYEHIIHVSIDVFFTFTFQLAFIKR